MTVVPDARTVLTVAAHIDARQRCLNPAERRVASVVIDDPELVAFSTVAAVAAVSDTTTGTVARLAARLGFDGFPALQRAMRRELVEQATPEEMVDDGRLARALAEAVAGEQAVVERALLQIDGAVLHTAGRLLTRRADRPGRVRVRVLSGDPSMGVALTFSSRLSALRAEVEFPYVPPGHRLGEWRPAGWPDVLVVFDAAPHDERLAAPVADSTNRGVDTIAIVDETSPLARSAALTLTVPTTLDEGRTTYVGMVALVNALAHEVAARLTAHA
jgi:DNA-binding MurR/RpiR family transcriptional regulator